jgi:hypothetical protein
MITTRMSWIYQLDIYILESNTIPEGLSSMIWLCIDYSGEKVEIDIADVEIN